MTLTLNETHKSGADKAQSYRWNISDEPGRMMMIPKTDLILDASYQRDVSDSDLKVKRLASEWSWIACGALIVADRSGIFYVVDGQHRARAAMKLSSIKSLPCIVFTSVGAKDEATAFLRANRNRKPMKAVQSFKAMIASGDPDAVFLDRLIRDNGMTVSQGQSAGRNVQAIGGLLQIAKDRGPQATSRVFKASVCASDNSAPHGEIIKGINYIDIHFDDPSLTLRMQERLSSLGKARILEGIAQAKAFRGAGGAKICAEGILSAYNHRLRNRIEI